MLTKYKIVIQIGKQLRAIRIEAASPLEALRKLKYDSAYLAFKNMNIKDIQEPKKKYNSYHIKLND